MSGEKNDGGPAFPVVEPDGDEHPGLSKRDWFAGMALQGLISDEWYEANAEKYAINAYRFADAMLKARGEK